MTSEIDKYHLPFAGRWFVAHAGDTLNVNHHMRARAQRYGIDFMKVGGSSSRRLFKSDGKTIEDFYSWGESVFAPVSGKLEAAIDGLPDNPIGIFDKQNTCGNYVVIRTKAGKFAFIAHLQNGSVNVKCGDDVKAGQPIGKCGNSGNSNAPHIHLHTQDTPAFNKGTGQNMVFGGINVELTGKIFENVDWPLIRGLFVWNGQT
ncbi:MAG: M23 family metallopeptidase [Verrucomicrobiia bacterium]